MDNSNKDVREDFLINSLKELYIELQEEEEYLSNEIFISNSRIDEITNIIKACNEEDSKNSNVFSPHKSSNRVKLNFQEDLEEKDRLEKRVTNLNAMYVKTSTRRKTIEECLDSFSASILEKQSKNDISAADFYKEVIRVQNFEKSRMSREIHDGTIQDLVFLSHKSELITKYIDQDPIRAKMELQSFPETIRTVICGLRRMIIGLKPMNISELKCEAIIINMLSEISELVPEIEMKWKICSFPNEFPEAEKVAFQCIIKELTINAVKSAKAEKVEVFVINENDLYCIQVIDNGVGFQVDEALNKEDHFGLRIVQERVKIIRGDIAFDSKIGKGTKVEIRIPKELY